MVLGQDLFLDENEVTVILGTHMELVDREVIDKQKELLVDTVRAVLGAKIEYIAMASRSVPENHLQADAWYGALGFKLYKYNLIIVQLGPKPGQSPSLKVWTKDEN